MWAFPQEDRRAIICSPLSGRRVLVVEDEALVSMVIEDILADQQSVVIGPFKHLQPALDAVHSAEIDFALLDVSPRGAKVFPIAEALSMRGIPFLLLSSYGAEVVSADHPEWRFCSKPFSGSVLVKAMLEEYKRGSPE